MNKPVTKSYVDENIPMPSMSRFSYILYKLERMTDFIVNILFFTAAIIMVFGMLTLYFSTGLQVAPRGWPSLKMMWDYEENH